MIGAVGEDEFGGVLSRALETDMIAAELAHRRDAGTGVALITVIEQGENTIVVAPGANASVDAALLESHPVSFDRADALMLQLEVPLPAVQHAASMAKDRGALVVLNAAPAQPLPEALLDLTDVLVVNEGEARRLLDKGPSSDTSSAAELARELAAFGPKKVIVTMGRDGAVAWDGSTLHEQAAFTVESIDAVGAGDAFVGTLTVELAQRSPLSQALRYACAAGALATTRAGAQPSLPRRERLESFLQDSFRQDQGEPS
jgi:ribokinase